MKMNSNVYKCCAVPLCTNTSISTPNKLFVYVPNKKLVRDKWLKLARRDPAGVVTSSSIYFCEDHFDLPNDMENYMQYHLMGAVSQVRMKPGCFPKNFACQPDRKTQASDTIERLYMHKKRKVVLEACKELSEESSMVTGHLNGEEIASRTSVQYNLEETQPIKVHMTKTFRSIANQTEGRLVHQMTPLKSSKTLLRRIVGKGEQSDTDAYTHFGARTESSPSTKSVQVESCSNCSETIGDKLQESLIILECTLKKITKNPCSYIGVPINCYYLINLIHLNFP